MYSVCIEMLRIWSALCIDLEMVGLLCMLVKVISAIKVRS